MTKEIKNALPVKSTPGIVSARGVSDDNSLAQYIQMVQKIPVLTAEQEYEYATQWLKNHDNTAAEKLVASHLKMVVSVAYDYKNYGIPVGDLIASGNMGLMQALQKFDPEKGFRFSTYALWWVKASIQKYILNSWSLVKLGTTSAQKKLFFNLRKIKNQLNLIDDKDMDDMTINNIASNLSVSPAEVKEMNSRMYSHDTSLNVFINNDSDDGTEFMDFVADSTPNQEDKLIANQTYTYRKKLFVEALDCLNPREKDILFKRRLYNTPQTLEELSNTYHISKERVRQIELNSINKLKKNIPTLQ